LSKFDVVAIGASAGGVQALKELLPMFPEDFPAAIFVDQHTTPDRKSMLVDILKPICRMDVKFPVNEEIFKPSTIYVCPSGVHMLINDGKCLLIKAAMPHFPKPSIDLLFESVAGSYEKKAIGVVLTGLDSDGALGIRAIYSKGGVTIAQDKATAAFPSMPMAAIKTGDVDYILELEKIAPFIIQLFL
jgi:two-component system, chemotaxis family, protein-glutamate methylesterase/glutaminase